MTIPRQPSRHRAAVPAISPRLLRVLLARAGAGGDDAGLGARGAWRRPGVALPRPHQVREGARRAGQYDRGQGERGFA